MDRYSSTLKAIGEYARAVAHKDMIHRHSAHEALSNIARTCELEIEIMEKLNDCMGSDSNRPGDDKNNPSPCAITGGEKLTPEHSGYFVESPEGIFTLRWFNGNTRQIYNLR